MLTELFGCITTAAAADVLLDVSQSVEEQVEVEPVEHLQAGHDEGQTADGLVSGRDTKQ